MVSAIITTCKRDVRIVNRAIQSICNQTYKDIEIIVVDDSPCDYEGKLDVEKLVQDISNNKSVQIRYISHEFSKGACEARNTGIFESRGDIIGFLDDDDEWVNNKVELMIPFFENKSVGLVYSNYIVHNEDTGKERYVRVDSPSSKPYDQLIKSNYIGGTSFPLLRKSYLVEAGLFDKEMQSSQDYDLWLRIVCICRVKYIDEYLNIYHEHEGEQISKNPYKRIAGLERIIEKNKEYLMSHPEAYYRRLMRVAPYYAVAGMKVKGIKIWFNASRIRPFAIISNFRFLTYILTRNRIE